MYKILKPTLAAKTPTTSGASSTTEYNSKIRKNMQITRNNERRDQRQSILNRNRCLGGDAPSKGVKSNCPTPTIMSTIKSSIRSVIGAHKPAFDFNKHIDAATTTCQSRPPLANKSTNATKKECPSDQSIDVNSTYLVNGANSSSSVSNNSKLTTSMPLTSSANQSSSNNRRKLLDEYLQKKKEQLMQKMTFNKSKPVAKQIPPTSSSMIHKPPPMPTSSTFTFNSGSILKANNIGSNLTRSQSTTSRKNVPINNGKNTPTAPAKPLSKSQSLYSKEAPKPFEKSLRSSGVAKPPVSTSIPKPAVSKLVQAKDYKKDLELITSKIDTSVVISAGCQSICNVTKIDSIMPNSTSSPIKDAVKKIEQAAKNQTPPPAQLVIEVVRKKSIQEPKNEENVPQLSDEYFNKVELNLRDVNYYKALVDYKTQCLNKLSTEWMKVCTGGQVSEDVEGDIRSVCGLANLLIDERFNQFNDLINQCRQCTANDPSSQSSSADQFELQLTVKCSDLQGFWDMVDCQIEDVLFKFAYMQKLKEHNFVKSDELFEKYGKKPAPAQTSTRPATSGKAPNRNYLKNTTKKDDAKPTESAEPTVKKAARPNFAQFRAQLKKQNSENSTPGDEIPIIIEEKKNTPVMNVVDENVSQLGELHDSMKKSNRRKSRKTIESGNLPLRYNLRSRKSDLISFDSPVPVSRINPPTLSVMDEETAELMENCPNMALNQPIENKENQPVEKVFSFDLSAPNTWSKFLAGRESILFNSPAVKTPRRTSVRDSLAPEYDRKSQLASISKSPLLKMAYISSHSKRLSINTLLNK